MPRRPPCVQCVAGSTKTVRMWVKPKSKALHIRLEDIDWLCSYAADQHHFQGIARGPGVDQNTAVAATHVEWDYTNKTWDVKVNDQSYDVPLGIMTEEIYDKLAGAYFGGHDEGSQQYQSVQRRKACRTFLEMWCEAALQGKQQEFANEWDCQIESQTKQQKTARVVRLQSLRPRQQSMSR